MERPEEAYEATFVGVKKEKPVRTRGTHLVKILRERKITGGAADRTICSVIGEKAQKKMHIS